jgi:hypothetical protein
MRTAALLVVVLVLALLVEVLVDVLWRLLDPEPVEVGKEVAEVVDEDEEEASEAFFEPHCFSAALHFSSPSKSVERSMHWR